jgi:sugar/nucleoside kinase (ribokinase family)
VLGNAGIETKIFVNEIPKKNMEAKINRIAINVGGSAAHVAGALAILGMKSYLVTQIGKDESGGKVFSELKALDVDLSYSIVSDNPTTSFFSIIDRNFNRMFLIKQTKLNEKALLGKFKEALQQSHLLVICPATPSLTLAAAKLGKKSDKLVIISPQAAFIQESQEWIRKFFTLANLIFLNEEELLYYTKASALSKALIHPLFIDDQIVVVTRGAKGCIVTSKGKIINSCGKHGQIVDSSGAGDAFLAGFLWSYTRNHDLKKASRMGCLAGFAASKKEELSEKVILLRKVISGEKV